MRSQMETMVDEMYHDGIKLDQALKEFERRYIEAALDRTRGNRTTGEDARDSSQHSRSQDPPSPSSLLKEAR